MHHSASTRECKGQREEPTHHWRGGGKGGRWTEHARDALFRLGEVDAPGVGVSAEPVGGAVGGVQGAAEDGVVGVV